MFTDNVPRLIVLYQQIVITHFLWFINVFFLQPKFCIDPNENVSSHSITKMN